MVLSANDSMTQAYAGQFLEDIKHTRAVVAAGKN